MALPRFVPPAERVKLRVAQELGKDPSLAIPYGYQRVGNVLLVRLPESLEPHAKAIGVLYREELGVDSVLSVGRVERGYRRTPSARIIAGKSGETLVKDGQVKWHLDASMLLYSAGNMEERHRMSATVRPGEVVIDLFAGIGYFSIPAAKLGRASKVYAVEKNPVAYSYLTRNIAENGVDSSVIPVLGDNRDVDIPKGHADRAILGYLPTSLPFVARAAELIRPEGGTMHIHSVASVRCYPMVERAVREAVARSGRRPGTIRARRVKSYGPSRDHVVADTEILPAE